MYLNCHTGFSFKYGTLPIKTLFNEAKRCGIHKLALTEINNTASYLELLRICYENQPQHNGLTKYGKEAYPLALAVGIEFRAKDQQLLYIILAKNNPGFEVLNRFLSYHNREGKPFPQRAPVMENTFVIYPFQQIEPETLHNHEFIGVGGHQLVAYAADPSREAFAHKFVALHPVTFLPPEKIKDKKAGRDKFIYRDHNTHRLLRCIAHNTLLSKLPEHLQARKDEYMLPEPDLRNRFAQFPDLLERSRFLLDQCSIECPPGEDKNKKYLRSNAAEDLQYLRAETEKGYAFRYGADRTIWNKHIEKELRIIAQKGFVSYYLITYDLILFARANGYDFVGRGSGANSTVAYCLASPMSIPLNWIYTSNGF